MKNAILFLICLFVTGCATSYHKAGFTGRGYQDEQLQADEFQVSFAGNSKLSQAKARQYALRRAAELTIEQGFDYFIVTNESAFAKSFVSGDAGGSRPEVVITVKCGKGTKLEGIPSAYDAKEFLQYATA